MRARTRRDARAGRATLALIGLATALTVLLTGSSPAAPRARRISVSEPVIWDGEAPGDQFGGEAALYCDLNRDGRPELIVGARSADPNGVTNAGSVYVYSGRNGQLLRRFNGTVQDGIFGLSVTCADINRDKYPDLVIGAPNQGRVFVYSGKNWSLLHQIEPQPNTLQTGIVLACADINRDRYPDIIAGAPNYGLAGAGNGTVVVYSGKDGTLLRRFDGASSGDQFGFSVAAGDVNRDGYADILVGAPRAQPDGRIDAGSATVYSGKNGSVLRAFSGPAPGDHLGTSVAAGDLNGDRYADVVTGAHGTDPEGIIDAGSLFVYSGRNGALIRRINGTRIADHVGFSTACVPLDGDPYPELITAGIQEPKPIPNRTENLWVYSGRTSAVLHHFEIPANGDVFGRSITALPPKGRTPGRIVVTAQEADPDGKTDAGSVYVFKVTR